MRLPPWHALFVAALVSNVVVFHTVIFRFGHLIHCTEENVHYQLPNEGNSGKKKLQQTLHVVQKTTESPKRYLIADLWGGLTNQAVEVWVALLVSEFLNRTLVLPQVRATIRNGGMFATQETGNSKSFNHIWDVSHFVECARQKLNITEVDIATNSSHYEAHINKDHEYVLQRFDGVDNINPLLNGNATGNELLMRLTSDTAEYVKIIYPFHYSLALKWNYDDCFRPSERILDMITQYKSTLGGSYACLHARTESDWFTFQCCTDGANTTSEHPEEWTCAKPSANTRCYMTPEKIVEVLRAELPLNSSLWVSSGSSRNALKPLYESFRVSTKDIANDSHYMDYSLAMVDQEVCKEASRFWGLDGSTFSHNVLESFKRKGGIYSYYNN